MTSRRYIKAEQELEYVIRFQNTGTDVAYNVVVKDTISEYLDISSLRVEAASHPFTYTVSGQGKPVITFTFRNINLPDHKADEPGSNGFVSFSLEQNVNNPKGTVIRNTAYNYFDYNSPIATNEVINMVGDTVLVPLQPIMVIDCGVDNPTEAKAGGAIALCETNQTLLRGNVPLNGVGRWKLIRGNATIEELENPASIIKNIGYGETVLEWSITLCKKISASMLIINRYQTPPPPTVAEIGLQCEGNPLKPLEAIGTQVAWYQDRAKQKQLATDNTFTPALTASTSFYVTQAVNGCESPVREAKVNLHPRQALLVLEQDTLQAPPADEYQWFFNNTLLTEVKGHKIVPKNTRTYQVVTVTKGCTGSSNALYVKVPLEQSTLLLRPNPVVEELTFTYAAEDTGEIQVFITNHLGIGMASIPFGNHTPCWRNYCQYRNWRLASMF